MIPIKIKKIFLKHILLVIGGLVLMYITFQIGSKLDNLIKSRNTNIIFDFKSRYPAWWSNGIPLPIYEYGDCESGCIQGPLHATNLAYDIFFWYLVSYLAWEIKIYILRNNKSNE